MSRLQVGGLALVIKAKNPKNIGAVVKIVGVGISFDWTISGELDFSGAPIGKALGFLSANSDQLLPLGDKQTQDELMKEKELECN